MPHQWIDPDNYIALFSTKIEQFQQQLESLSLNDKLPHLESFDSPPSHYRMRAEFKVWHEGEQSHLAMIEPKTGKRLFIDQFPVASTHINKSMMALMQLINQSLNLRKKLFQAEWLSTQAGETLLTLIYHRPLDDIWIEEAKRLSEKLKVHLIGRSRKQRIVIDQDYVTETLTINNKAYTYQQIENSFTQPNAVVCEKMITWAVEHSHTFGGDLLELYCGNGNFTLPLSQNFRQVLATEISKTSIKSALKNCEDNAIDNIQFVRLSSEEATQALNKIREFRRLKDISLDDYQFSTIFVDPPRAGLDEHTLKLAANFNNIIYISCNPNTLIENLKELSKTHIIRRLAAFDQFPYTPHLEAGVILEKIHP